MRPFSATRSHSADDPTPAIERLNVVREPTPAQRETSSNQRPLPTVRSTAGRVPDAASLGMTRCRNISRLPFRRTLHYTALFKTCVFDLGATDPISFADRSETFSTTALRVLPKFKLLPPR